MTGAELILEVNVNPSSIMVFQGLIGSMLEGCLWYKPNVANDVILCMIFIHFSQMFYTNDSMVTLYWLRAAPNLYIVIWICHLIAVRIVLNDWFSEYKWIYDYKLIFNSKIVINRLGIRDIHNNQYKCMKNNMLNLLVQGKYSSFH